MLYLMKQVLTKGICTEPVPESTDAWHVEGARIQDSILALLGRALTIRHIEGCGIKFVASPRHADMLLVTGPVARNMQIAVKRAYDATPSPKLVVAVGDCGCTGGIFGETYASCGRVANVIPVNVAIPGCPPPPREILRGILSAVSQSSR